MDELDLLKRNIKSLTQPVDFVPELGYDQRPGGMMMADRVPPPRKKIVERQQLIEEKINGESIIWV